jgi:hypothetical protein
MIAGAADKIVQTCSLAAENDDEIAREIELVVVGGSTFVETDDPKIVVLKVFEGAHQVDDTRDAKVLGCAGAGFDGRGREGCGTTLGKDNAVDARAVGNAKQCAKVLRIFNAIERENEAGRGGPGGIGSEEILDGEELLRTDQCDNALMRGSLGGKRKLLPSIQADTDARLAALLDEALKTIVKALTRNEDVIKVTAAGFESFLDRVQAVEDFHKIILVCDERDQNSSLRG